MFRIADVEYIPHILPARGRREKRLRRGSLFSSEQPRPARNLRPLRQRGGKHLGLIVAARKIFSEMKGHRQNQIDFGAAVMHPETPLQKVREVFGQPEAAAVLELVDHLTHGPCKDGRGTAPVVRRHDRTAFRTDRQVPFRRRLNGLAADQTNRAVLETHLAETAPAQVSVFSVGIASAFGADPGIEQIQNPPPQTT